MSDRSFLDWPFFGPAHRDLAGEIEAWAARALPGLLPAASEEPGQLDATVRHVVQALGDAGLLQLCVPEDCGGRGPGLDVRSLCLAREVLARHAGLADFAFAMQGLGSAPISLFGDAAQKAEHLPGVAAGRTVTAFALSEPEAGSEVAALRTRATADGSGYRLDGVKTWISNAGLADLYTVFARIEGAPTGSKGLGAFIVPAATPGLDASERIEVSAPHPLGSVRLEDCRVPASAMIGAPGDGFRIAMATLDAFRATVGAAALGFARRALDEALRRSRERRVFGQLLAEHQITRGKIADMAVAVDAAALLVYRAAWSRDTRSGRVTRESSMAKLFATEAAQRVVDEAVQLFGGLGVVRGVPVEQLYREVRALRIYEGTSEIQRLVIAGKTYGAWDEGAGVAERRP